MLSNLTRMNAESITQSDITTYNPPLKFLQVFAVNGTIKIQNGEDQDVTYTIDSVANGAASPFIIPGLIKKVYDTDTTIANSALIGYR